MEEAAIQGSSIEREEESHRERYKGEEEKRENEMINERDGGNGADKQEASR